MKEHHHNFNINNLNKLLHQAAQENIPIENIISQRAYRELPTIRPEKTGYIICISYNHNTDEMINQVSLALRILLNRIPLDIYSTLNSYDELIKKFPEI